MSAQSVSKKSGILFIKRVRHMLPVSQSVGFKNLMMKVQNPWKCPLYWFPQAYWLLAGAPQQTASLQASSTETPLTCIPQLNVLLQMSPSRVSAYRIPLAGSLRYLMNWGGMRSSVYGLRWNKKELYIANIRVRVLIILVLILTKVLGKDVRESRSLSTTVCGENRKNDW